MLWFANPKDKLMRTSALELPLIRQTRRNHALEHATIHLLSARVRGVRLSGLSDPTGFTLFGEVPTAQVEWAANEALRRLDGGERGLALHPNCGTNLVTTGYLTSIVGLLTTRNIRRPQDVTERLPIIMLAMIGAVVISQPIGMWLQANVTTDGDPADTAVLSITRADVPTFSGKLAVHRVQTRSS